MSHVIDRITHWIKVNGDLSDDGRSLTVTTIHEESKFVAGFHLCDGYELLHIGHYRTDGKACGEIVFQIRDGEFTRIMPPEDPQEDGDCLDCLVDLYSRHMAACPAPF